MGVEGTNLVWLEPSGHEDSKYVRKLFFDSSVNEMALQNIWQQHFLLLGALSEVGETVAQIWHQVVGIAALQEFYKNDEFLTAPCGFFHELSA
jgi:hypothetical protein